MSPTCTTSEMPAAALITPTRLGKSTTWAAPYGVSPITAMSTGAVDVEIHGGSSQSTPTEMRPLRINRMNACVTPIGFTTTSVGASITQLGTTDGATPAQAAGNATASSDTTPTGSRSIMKAVLWPGVRLNWRVTGRVLAAVTRRQPASASADIND